jgi:hypothetical protein
MPNEQQKICKVCNASKPLTHFSPQIKGKYGVRSICKPCSNEQYKIYRLSNPEKAQQIRKKHYEKNRNQILQNAAEKRLNNLSKYRQKDLAYYYAHQKELNEKRIKNRLENLEHYRAKGREKYNRTRDKQAAYKRNRRAKKANSLTEIYTVADILAKWGTLCHICNQEIDLLAPRQMGKTGWQRGLHLDHVIPIAKGGNDIIDNVKPAHAICNARKGDR